MADHDLAALWEEHCRYEFETLDWMLPGIPPTGRRVEVSVVAVVRFHDGKLVHEHIYWDQASVLVQIGRLDPAGLPVAGAETARKVLPSNAPMRNWASSEGKPVWRAARARAPDHRARRTLPAAST